MQTTLEEMQKFHSKIERRQSEEKKADETNMPQSRNDMQKKMSKKVLRLI